MTRSSCSSRAAEAFLSPLPATADRPFPSPPYLLALRQGGLRDDLIRLATERGVPGWFGPAALHLPGAVILAACFVSSAARASGDDQAPR